MMRLWSTSALVESTVPKFMTNVSGIHNLFVIKCIQSLNITTTSCHLKSSKISEEFINISVFSFMCVCSQPIP